tara:strand:- start:52 stop:498 length:447 start_codon:yes stop_codon:yes gene_type:complete
MSFTRQQIADVAKSYLGTPWLHQGRAKGKAIDCIGLLVGIAKEIGYPVRDREGYPLYPDDVSSLLLEIIEEHKLKRTTEVKKGNILVFRIGRAKFPSHVGVLVEEPDMVHAMNFRSKSMKLFTVRQHIYAGPWVGRTHSIWEVPGVID